MRGQRNTWRNPGHGFLSREGRSNPEFEEEYLRPCIQPIPGWNEGKSGLSQLMARAWFSPLEGESPFYQFTPVGSKEWKEHIGEEIKSQFPENPELKNAIRDALNEIDSYLDENYPDGQYSADIERDYENPEYERNVIRVKINIESVDEWRRAKDRVREIAREVEQEDVQIYTRVDRIR